MKGLDKTIISIQQRNVQLISSGSLHQESMVNSYLHCKRKYPIGAICQTYSDL